MLTALAAAGLWSLGPPILPPEPEPEPEPSEVLQLEIRGEGAGACPVGADLPARLGVLLPTLEVEVTPEPRGGGPGPVAIIDVAAPPDPGASWEVDLVLTSPLGEHDRRLEAESCPVVVDALALLIAVAFDPVSAANQIDAARRAKPEPEPELEPGPERGPEPELEPDRSLETEPVARPRVTAEDLPPWRSSSADARGRGDDAALRAGLGALAGGGYGPLASGSAALVPRFALFGEGWRWELRGAWLPPLVRDVGGDRQLRFDGWWLGTRGCWVPTPGPVELPLCAGVEAGSIRGEALAPVLNARSGSQPWVALELGPGLSWSPRPRLAVGVEASVPVPLAQAGFALDEEPVLRYAPAGVRVLGGIELRLP